MQGKMAPAFIVHMIRNVRSPRKDDRIEIKPHTIHNILYHISYEDATLEDSKAEFLGTRRDVYQYLESLFRGQMYDDDPYAYIQVTPPCFPAILLTREYALKASVQDNIFNMLRQSFSFWEAARNKPKVARQRAAQLPPLIPEYQPAEQPAEQPVQPPGGDDTEPVNGLG